VILLDVDHFKSINDGQGHAAGDDVLVQVAQLLRSHLRRNDSVARYGGEEFLVLLADGDLASGRRLAESLRVALRGKDVVLSNGDIVRVTASFGVAQGALDPIGWHALVRAADTAMYAAKALGRDRVQVATGGRAVR